MFARLLVISGMLMGFLVTHSAFANEPTAAPGSAVNTESAPPVDNKNEKKAEKKNKKSGKKKNRKSADK